MPPSFPTRRSSDLSASSARTFTAGLIWRFATVVLGCVPNTSWVAAPGVILKPLLVAGIRPAGEGEGEWLVPVLLALKSPKLATPFTAATVVVPLSVLPPGLVPSATVTLPVKLGTGFPAGSSAVTCTAGLIAAPATVFDGWTVKASCVGAPGRMSDGVLVPGAKPPALAARV